MAVQPQTPYKEFIANGVSKEFPLDFDVVKKDHLIVLINDEDAPVGSWILDAENDSIIFLNPPEENTKIRVRRDTPLARTTDYQAYNASFNPPSVNIDFDNIWLKLQEMGVLNWMVENNVKDLNDYVDSLNDETKTQFFAEIQKQGISLTQLESFANQIYKNLAKVAVEKGWFAEFIADGEENQKQINDKTTQFVESFADLKNFNPRKNGFVIHLKSWHKNLGLGEGHFYYNQYSLAEEDGGTVVKIPGYPGALERVNVSPVTPEMFGAKADKITDDYYPIQAALNYISTTKWLGSISAQNNSGASGVLRADSKSYRFTKTLWIGAYTNIQGCGELGFKAGSIDNATKFIADLEDPLQPAFSTSNFKIDGARILYDEKTTGAMYDNSLVSATHGVKISGISIVAKKQSYIGLRVQNSPQASIFGVYIDGFDYSILLNASWQVMVVARTMHNKCGVLAEFDNNGLILEGYYNSTNKTPLITGKNLITHFTSDTDTSTLLNNENTKYGVCTRYGLSMSSRQLICEHNDVGFAISNGDAVIQTLYAEGNTISSFAGFSTKVSITNLTGYYDASSFLIGANCKVENDNYSQGGVVTPIAKLSRWNSRLIVDLTFPYYQKGVVFKNAKNILYLSSTGDDKYNGLANHFAIKTLDALFKRISENNWNYADSATVFESTDRWTVVVLDDKDYYLNKSYSLNNQILFKPLGSSKPTFIFNQQLVLSDASLTFKQINIKRPDVLYSGSWDVQNGAFNFRDGLNKVGLIDANINIENYGLACVDFNGASQSTLIFNRCTTTVGENAVLIQSNYENQRPHIFSLLHTGGVMDSKIVSMANKGINLPSGWQNKILGL